MTLPMQKLTWLGNHKISLPLSLSLSLSLGLSLSLSLLYQSGIWGGDQKHKKMVVSNLDKINSVYKP